MTFASPGDMLGLVPFRGNLPFIESKAMSWDVVLRSPNNAMGPKEQARETFLLACERIIGEPILRRGPTEVAIDSSFRYEVGFIGQKRAIESLSLSFQIVDGDPHQEPQHPVW